MVPLEGKMAMTVIRAETPLGVAHSYLWAAEALDLPHCLENEVGWVT